MPWNDGECVLQALQWLRPLEVDLNKEAQFMLFSTMCIKGIGTIHGVTFASFYFI